jgi:hypothetical protein
MIKTRDTGLNIASFGGNESPGLDFLNDPGCADIGKIQSGRASPPFHLN